MTDVVLPDGSSQTEFDAVVVDYRAVTAQHGTGRDRLSVAPFRFDRRGLHHSQKIPGLLPVEARHVG